MLDRFVNTDQKTISNTIIEGFNKIFKVDDLKNNKYLRLSIVLRHLKGLSYYLIAIMYQRLEKSKCNVKAIIKALQSYNKFNDNQNEAFNRRKKQRNHSRPLEGKVWKKKKRNDEEEETQLKEKPIRAKRRGK